MAAVVGITTRLIAQDHLSPAFIKISRQARKTKEEMLGMDKATADLVQEMRNMKQAAEQNYRAMQSELNKAKQEIAELRGQLNALGSIHARPQVSIDDQARREISSIRSDLKALDGQKATAQVEVKTTPANEGGTFLAGGAVGAGLYGGSGFFSELAAIEQAKARYQTLSGNKDDAYIQQKIKELTQINPYQSRPGSIDMFTEASMYDKPNAATTTKQALQLSYIRPDMASPEEYQKAIFAMRNAMPNIEAGRFGDAMAEIVTKTTDIRNEAIESLTEYSVQTTKFIDTPEKMAALMKEMNGLWSIDKGFDALKETTLKLYNQGDLTNVLKTAYETKGMESKAAAEIAAKEAEMVSKAISSGSAADRQFAVGALMQTFGSIKDDNVRQQLLNELGAGPGEDLNTNVFAKLLVAAGKISMADPNQYNYDGKLEQTYKQTKENNPLSEFIDARNAFTTELLNLGIVLADDITPAINGFAKGIGWAAKTLENMPAWGALATLTVVIGGTATAFWLVWQKMKGIGQSISDRARAKYNSTNEGEAEQKQRRSLFERFRRKKEEEELPAYRRPVEDHSMYGTPRKQEPEKKQSWFSRMKDAGEDLGNNKPSYFQRAVNIGGKAVKGAGIVGAVAGTAAAGYELYQTAKTSGWRNAVSQRGGAVAGGAIGGVVGGAAGSLLGPVGTAAGAYVGNQIGSKLGGMIDAKGWTASAVKQLDSLKTKAAGTFDSLKSKATGAFSSLKAKTVGWWSGSDAKKAQTDMQAVGSAAKSGGQQVSQASQQAGQSVKQLGTISTQSTNQIKTGAQQAGQSFQTVSSAAGSAASQTKAHLESIGGVVGKGSSWGANLIDMVAGGIRAKLPSLASAASKAASTIKNFLGFSSPTKEGPASNSDRWAPNFINMFADGIDEQIIGRKMSRVAATMNQPLRGQASIDVMPHSKAAPGGDIPVSTQFSKPSGVSVQVGDINVTFDVGDMLGQVQNGAEFLKAISSPQGKKVLKTAMNQIIVEACELGG